MKKTLLAGIFGLMMVIAACGNGGEGTEGNGAEPEANGTAAGEELYQQNCAQCHGGDLSGGGAPGLQDAGADYDQDEVVSIILEGYGSMAPVQGVDEGEAEDIAEFVVEQ
ncbi:cytochrome c [Alkalibacillus silvisoli]|uniref:Cytochrome c-551 n=1 Tax=Alkalibacillus silvisoli TaxID=392823 RepID=A0ABP3JRX0_9BACI